MIYAYFPSRNPKCKTRKTDLSGACMCATADGFNSSMYLLNMEANITKIDGISIHTTEANRPPSYPEGSNNRKNALGGVIQFWVAGF